MFDILGHRHTETEIWALMIIFICTLNHNDKGVQTLSGSTSEGWIQGWKSIKMTVKKFAEREDEIQIL
jgi:hypothetical protein